MELDSSLHTGVIARKERKVRVRAQYCKARTMKLSSQRIKHSEHEYRVHRGLREIYKKWLVFSVPNSKYMI